MFLQRSQVLDGSDGRFKERLAALDWKYGYDCEIKFAFICRFVLLAIAAVKKAAE